MVDNSVQQSTTVPELVMRRCQSSPDAPSHEQEKNGKWELTSYRELGELVKHAALGFDVLGLKHSDSVAIWGDTMAEWTILDLGALTCGGVVVGIYQTNSDEQVTFIAGDCNARFLCVDNQERLEKALRLKTEMPSIEKIIVWNAPVPAGNDLLLSYEQLLALGKEAAANAPGRYEALVASVKKEDVALLIYTSGTTGMPKGVILTHDNCVSNCKGLVDNDFVMNGDTLISFLPMSHVAEHAGQFMGRLYAGCKTYFCPSITDVPRVMQEKSPTILVAVPRLYEKIQQKILTKVSTASPTRKKLFYWAMDIGLQVARLKAENKPVPTTLALKHQMAEKLVLSKIKQAFGGKVRIMISAAAPIDVEVIEFFQSMGILFLEAYGLSESCGASHANTPRHYKVGTVGQPVRGCECVLADDGEVLLKGSGIFKGYHNRPDATAEVFDEKGWFHTGDIGVIDEEGFLKITDRKKNLIITAGGKNVAPAQIELLISRDPIISQVVVLGDRKPYLVALVTLSNEAVEAEKLTPQEVEKRVQEAVDDANQHLARYEQIKHYKILNREFSIENGEMTPTMKLKRNVIMKKFEPEVESMYEGKEEAAKAS